MFLKELFKKDELFLRAEVRISNISTFKIIEKSPKTNDKELILLGLLIYARILRIEPLQVEKDSIVSLFIEFGTNHKTSNNKEESMEIIVNFFDLVKNGHNFIIIKEFKTTVKLMKNKEEEFYLYMGNILVDPLSSVVYTAFKFIIDNIKKENQVYLLEGFVRLSKMYKIEKFSSIDAVIIPNVIVEEITNLD